MNKAQNFKNNRVSFRLLASGVALTIGFSLNIAAAQTSDSDAGQRTDYLSTILTQTKGKVFRYKMMPIKVFIESDCFEERNACEQAFDLWLHGTDRLISFESVSNEKMARVIIKFVSLPNIEESLSQTSAEGAHTMMEWHFQKRLLRLGGAKAYVPPQIVEINLRSAELRPVSQRSLVLQNIIAHELGHVVGLLGHSVDPGDLMYSKTDENSKFSTRDLNTVRRLYRLKANIYL